MDCKKGEYYCRQDKKCKPIPKGYYVMPDGTLMSDDEHDMSEGWSDKYKKSIDCDNPKGFSQRAHCQGKKKKMNEEGLRDWFGKSKSKDGKSGWVNVVTGGTCASDEPGEGTPKCVSSAKRASMTKKERLSAQRRKKAADPGQQQKTGAAKPTYVSTDKPVKKEEKDHEVSMAQSQLSNAEKDIKKLKKGLGKKEKNLPAWMQAKITDTEHNMDAASSYVDEAKDEPGKGSGKKDACYHKVKARYDVWPSAYASGALVKCRKKGAKNWGTKSEEFMALPEFSEIQINAMRKSGIEVEVIDEACWKGYTQKGMKKKGDKMVPNCVPVNKEEVEIEEARIPAQNGNIYMVVFTWRGKMMYLKIFFPETRRPSRAEVTVAINKIYPGARLRSYDMTVVGQGDSYLNAGSFDGGSGASMGIPDIYAEFGEETEVAEGAAWTKKSGKNPSGGLNEKGRKSYERENPGSDLKAPSKKVGNPRRASFCARMKGMKKKLTSAKTANDPDSRINKSLRAWNC
jgi:hypothetical protein